MKENGIDMEDNKVNAGLSGDAALALGQSSKTYRILVAEDNDSNYLLVKAILKGYDLVRAENGELAVQYVKQDTFDLVLMDLKMPVMGGLEATEKIREFNQQIPIIAVTANSFDTDKFAAKSAGCNDFVAKPINRMILFDALHKYL